MSINVELVSYTPDPELAVAAAARSCVRNEEHYQIRGQLSATEVRRLVATVIAKGHHSVLEHASFTFAISGVSRVFTHQLVRHRIASYSQLSQQRVDASHFGYIIPPEVQEHPELVREYEDAMERCWRVYRRLTDHGISIGSARYVLPSACTSRIVMTMNARSLFNLISQRECAVEEWEFRQVASLIHKRLLDVAPDIFRFAGPRCETEGVCPEGEIGLTCKPRVAAAAVSPNGRAKTVQALARVM